MGRYTRKRDRFGRPSYEAILGSVYKDEEDSGREYYAGPALTKLGEIEDVLDESDIRSADELRRRIAPPTACPIDVIFKALTQGIYAKTVGRSNSNLCQTIITKIKSPALRMASDGSGRIRLERTAPTRLGPDSFELGRYGIDWALTREELM